MAMTMHQQMINEDKAAAMIDRAEAITHQYGGELMLKNEVLWQDHQNNEYIRIPSIEWAVGGAGFIRLLNSLEQLSSITRRAAAEESARAQSPAVQKAWEHYQLLLAMEGTVNE